MLRGGSWNNDDRNCRASNRNDDRPANRNDNNGFRASSTHEPESQSPTAQASALRGVQGEDPGLHHGVWPESMCAAPRAGNPAGGAASNARFNQLRTRSGEDGMTNGNDMWPRRVPLSSGRVTSVGRSRENDVVLAHPSVSGQHCRLEPDAAGWLLVDAGAKFGTTVNGTRVVRVALKNGDVVRFASGPDYRFDGQALQLLDAGVGDG
ncbi:FHA domain-containing protein, partial [Candidatus Kaiserbacteria bacterium]|nr:FHA domain-containing protein [Candidatus Kaiserbacteria bacterium]